MIGSSGTVRVLVATKPVDFRKGADGLAALVRDTQGADPFSGTAYVFRTKRADRIKLVFWDGTAVVLVAKRLEDGEFRWPKTQVGVLHLWRLNSRRCSKVWTGVACIRHVRSQCRRQRVDRTVKCGCATWCAPGLEAKRGACRIQNLDAAAHRRRIQSDLSILI